MSTVKQAKLTIAREPVYMYPHHAGQPAAGQRVCDSWSITAERVSKKQGLLDINTLPPFKTAMEEGRWINSHHTKTCNSTTKQLLRLHGDDFHGFVPRNFLRNTTI